MFVTGLALLALGVSWMLAAWLGGGGLVLGSALAVWMALGGQSPSAAGAAMGRLLAGMASKWLALLLALLLGMAVWHVPPLGMIVGVVVALVTQTVVMLRH